ncbi:MAG: thiamine-phosphate pyrophosphorylase [Endomicrobia bacterium]|nr:thiamine-phosphate pyrophosphorylase [Endomicrobiia bacterium]
MKSGNKGSNNYELRITNYESKAKTKKKLVIPECLNRESAVAVHSALRIVDANLNRCREGLRVVEDSLRYVLNDGTLYKKIRAIRHNADKVLRSSYAALIQKRDTITDSGREMPETSKKDLPSIMIANFKRAQESLRVLEEYSKTMFPEASSEFKKQRYAVYNSEKAVYLKYKKMFKTA